MEYTRKIMLKAHKGYEFLSLTDILYIEARDKYAKAFTITGKEVHIFHGLKQLEQKLRCGDYLGPLIFCRIHRQYIAAMHYAVKWPSCNELLLERDQKVPVGKIYREALRNRFLTVYDESEMQPNL